jgi:hypothetical protein
VHGASEVTRTQDVGVRLWPPFCRGGGTVEEFLFKAKTNSLLAVGEMLGELDRKLQGSHTSRLSIRIKG